MNQRILANLGFLLQIAGLLTIVPIVVGFAYNETQQVIPLFITCTAFLGGGFLLNALCERKDLNVKSSSVLLLLAFLILPLIGAIPYIYLDPFNSAGSLDRFTNSYFESVSGFTTTGFSFIASSDALPRSLLVFRSITELMGGVGVVFLILAFFQSKRALPKLGGVLGIDNLSRNLRKMFFFVLAIYGVYILVFTGLFFAAGYRDLLVTGTFVIDTLTGGFAPSTQQFQQYLFFVPQILMILLMFFGSVNFAFNYHLLTGKIRKMFTLEIGLFLAIIAAASIALAVTANIGLLDSVFHVVSMASSTGNSYVNISALNPNAVSILIALMVIGGCAFSMAGGIKVSRLITLASAVGTQTKAMFTKSARKKKEFNEDVSEAFPAVVSILLFVGVLVVFALLYWTMGVSFETAVFEVGSALSTTGASLGATNVAMPLAYKWLIIAAMTIGRVETLTILTVLFPFVAKRFGRKR